MLENHEIYGWVCVNIMQKKKNYLARRLNVKFENTPKNSLIFPYNSPDRVFISRFSVDSYDSPYAAAGYNARFINACIESNIFLFF